MEHEEGLVISAGSPNGFIRAPGKPSRIFLTSEAPPGLKKLRSVKYRVVPQPDQRYDRAVDIQLMDVA